MKWMLLSILASCGGTAAHYASVCEVDCLASLHSATPVNCNAIDYDFRLTQGLLPDSNKSCEVISRLKEVVIREWEPLATGIYYVPERLEVDSQMATLMDLLLRHWEYTELNVDPPQQLNWTEWGWPQKVAEYGRRRVSAR